MKMLKDHLCFEMELDFLIQFHQNLSQVKLVLQPKRSSNIEEKFEDIGRPGTVADIVKLILQIQIY